MSSSSISSSLPASTAAALASTNSTPPLQITGLASGLNTQQIISELMTIAALPVTNLTNQQNGLTALNAQLTTLQTSLQTVALNAQALSDPVLFEGSQSVVSSDPSLISATSSSGAGIGGHLVSVTALASSASRTYSFTSPSAADTIAVGAGTVNLAAGATSQNFVDAVNQNASSLGVTAALNYSGQVVLYSTATGSTAGVSLSDPGGALSEQTALARAGQNAQFSIDSGPTQSSTSNTVANAIPGVSLTLNGLTTTPVSVTVQPPSVSASGIEAAVNTFVQSYNSVVQQIQTQLNQAPSQGSPGQATLYGDSEFQNLLNDMRTANYTPGAGLPNGMASLADIGISTGAAVGSGAVSQNSLSGQLTVNQTTLANAIATNPNGVRQVLQSWAQSFSAVVNNEAAPGGSIDTRIQGDNSEIAALGNQIADQNAMLVTKQASLTAQFAALEAAMSQSQAQGSWLTGQVNSLNLNSAAAASAGTGPTIA